MKPEDLAVRGHHRSGFQVEIRVGNTRFVDSNVDLFDTPGEAEERRLEILAAEDGVSSNTEAVPWTDQQRSDWEMVERKLRDLNLAYENHEMLRSGEMVSGQPDASCRNERWNMVTFAHALSLELTRCIAAEHNHET